MQIVKILLLVMLIVSCSYSQHVVTVSWNNNIEDDLQGYKVYFGIESGNYDYIYYNELKTSVVIDSLTSGNVWYFAVTAYDTALNESGFSEEVSISFDTLLIDSNNTTILNNCMYDSGNFYIYGMDGDRSGFYFNPPYEGDYTLLFDITMTGYGICVDTSRFIDISFNNELEKYAVYHELISSIAISDINTQIMFDFRDDCYIEGESDANIKISNARVIFGTVNIKINKARKGKGIHYEKN
jgi:hypothetical protein